MHSAVWSTSSTKRRITDAERFDMICSRMIVSLFYHDENANSSGLRVSLKPSPGVIV